MKLKTAATLPLEWSRGHMESLFKKIDDQVNNLTDGKVNAVTNSYTAAPAGGTHAIGDIVRNTNTVEIGVAPNNYVILGWICTLGGTPGTFTEIRADSAGAISVGGPGTSTDNAVARWNGTGGNTLKNSVVLIGNTGDVTGVTTQSMSGQLTSTLVTGTSPMVVASTTKVANLNVDSLDDQSGAYYLDSANFTGTNWTDLTDTGATTLHKHDHGGQDGLADNDHPQYLLVADIDDVPVNGEIAQPISSNWAFDHVAAADPHTGYRLESADHNHQSTGAQAGTLDHGLALTGLADDDHTQYLLASDATNRATFAANWTDLTDGGATTLHTHSYADIYAFAAAYG